MKNRKWQRILSWILTMTMLLGTFESNILAVNAMDDEAVEADAEIDEEEVVEADGDVEIPDDPDDDVDDTAAVWSDGNGIKIEGTFGARKNSADGSATVQAAYGAEMTKAEFTATVEGGSTVAWKLFEGDCTAQDYPWKAVTDTTIDGISFTGAGNVYTIQGTPTAAGNKTFTLSAVSSNNTTSANVVVNVNTSYVNKANLTFSETGWNWAEVEHTMGYTVDATKAASTNNVVPKTITLRNATNVDLNGLYVKLEGDDAESFELTGAQTSLAKDGSMSLTIAPKAGLVVKNSAKGVATTFNAKLSVSADCLGTSDNNKNELPISFKLVNDIAVAVTKDAVAYTKEDLGTVSAGNALPTIVYTATGVAGGLQWNEASLLHPTTHKSLFPEGVTATISNSGETLTIAGTPAVKSGNVGDYTFSPSVNDANGNWYELPAQTITVDYADVDYAIDGQDVDTYSKAVYSGYSEADTTAVVTVKNNSETAVKIKATLTNPEDFRFVTDATQTIAAGAEAQFKVVAVTGKPTGTLSAEIRFTGDDNNAIANKEINYSIVIGDGITITKPISDNTALPAAIVGTAYEGYQFEAKGAKDNTAALKWAVSENNPYGGNEGVPDGYTYVTKDELKNNYGLELSESGLLSGTPKALNADKKEWNSVELDPIDNTTYDAQIAFIVSVNQANVATASYNMVTISFNKAGVATISVKDAAGNELEGKVNVSQNGAALSLGTVATNLKNSVSASVATKVTADADFGKLDVTIHNAEKWNDTTKKYDDPSIDLFDGVFSKTDNKVSANKAEEDLFWIKTTGNVNTAAAGSYRALVTINGNGNAVEKTFYVTLDIINSPTYYGFYKTDKNSSVNADNNPENYRTIEATVNADIVSVNLIAVSKNDASKTPIDVNWTWEPATANDSIPEGLSLSTAGKITGTPTDAGTYHVSVNMVDSNNVKETVNITITVAGTGDIAILDGTTPIANKSIVEISNYKFPGVVIGKTAGIAKSFVIKNDGDTDLSNISIAIQDVEGYTGSAAHFTLDKNSIASLAKNTSEVINITPTDSSKTGIFKAKVKVSSKTTPDREFYVWFGVVDELKINDIPAADLAWTVGKEATVTVSACTVSYNKVDGSGVVSQNETEDITWVIKTVSANGTDLKWTELVSSTVTGENDHGIKGVKTFNIVPSEAGTRYVSINAATVAAEGGLIAKQSVDLKLTIEVAKSASVNVIKASGNAGEGYATGTSTSANGFITSYTFAPKAVGYKDAGKESATFTVKNASETGIVVSGNRSNAYFEVNTTDDETLALASDGTRTYTVTPSENLAAGTYTGQFTISGKNIETQTVELSFTVEAANPAISVSDNDGKSIADGIVLDAVKQGAETINNTTISVNNAGNVNVSITDVREVKDAEGTNYAVGETGKKLDINSFTAGVLKPGEYANFNIKPVNDTTVSENETFVKVSYSAGSAAQTPVVFKVNYTIYNKAVSVNFTPSENLVKLNDASVSENYTTTYSKAITLTNGEAGVAGNTTDVLHNLKVTIAAVNDTPEKSIELTGAKYKLNNVEVVGVKELAKGDSFSINVAAAKGLPYGIYNAEVTFEADNLAPVKKTVSFNVSDMAPDYVVDITTEGTEDVYASNVLRLKKSLDNMTGFVTENKSKYTINADKYGAADVEVDLSVAGKAVIKKLDTSTVSAASVTISQNGTTPASPSFNQITFNIYDIVSFNAAGGTFADNGANVISVNVANGKTLAADKFPSVSKNGASLKGWIINDGSQTEFTSATKVSENIAVIATWSTHTYPASASGNTASINWTWQGSESDNFAGTYVTIKCIDSDCPDRVASELKIPATVTVTGKDASCETGSAKVYTATAQKDSNTYTDTKTIATDKGLEHQWVFDKDSVVWAEDYSSATISKNCVAKYHDETRDGAKKVGVTTTNISFNGVEATCTTSGNGVFVATFTSADDPAISENIVVSVNAPEVKPLGHKWVVKSATSNGSFETAPTEATMNIECANDATHTESVSATSITLVSSNDTQKTYKYEGTASDKQTVSYDEVFYSHKEHDYTVSFNWISVSTNKADTVVTAEATCKNGGEKTALDVTLTDKTIGSKIEYTATATDPNGKVWTSKKNIDTKSGEAKDGPAGTPTVEGGDIVIIGVEETYAFTGSRIKPVITVMDGDIVLAQSKDYSVSYTGKNKIGETNTVEVKGKGNYAGKSATAKFTIVDPRAEVDETELADNVKKVEVSEKNFTYDGTAKYPATVTVTLKDKSKIVYTYEGDGEYSTDSDKKVGLSFSNNVNKGTATVAAYGGKDKKPAKATYKIAAADISTAEFEISAVDWAVKAATPAITATIKLGDEDVELVAGQDYKVSFKAKAAGENAGVAKITGKGNFKGKHADVTYTVNPMEITEENIIVKALAGKKAKDVKVTVVDGLGNAINKKFYTVEIQNAEGTALNKKDALTEEITVVVKAANAAVTADENGVSVTVTPKADIAKVKGAFKVDKAFFKYYTGEAITLDEEDFGPAKIVVGELKYGEDFAIVGYKNNIKKGTMIVTVQGIGDTYSGTKTFKVKIKAKPLDKAVTED